MLELKELLGKASNVVTYQNLFEIDTLNYDVTWYMGWIFPRHEIVNESLLEHTTLRRK